MCGTAITRESREGPAYLLAMCYGLYGCARRNIQGNTTTLSCTFLFVDILTGEDAVIQTDLESIIQMADQEETTKSGLLQIHTLHVPNSSEDKTGSEEEGREGRKGGDDCETKGLEGENQVSSV